MGTLKLAKKFDPNAPLVVVFGGAGYIGSWVTKLLLDDGYRVRVYDNFLYGGDGLSGLDSPNLEIIQEDICNTKPVSSATIGAEAVILLSAIVGHRSNENFWKTTRDVNFLASTVVLDAAIEHGVERFIFASTDSVYGIQEGLMYETGLPEPISLYSRLKLRMEGRIMSEKTRFFHPSALRFSNCYGLSPRMRFDLITNGIVRDAVLNGKVRISAAEDSRSFINVKDAARACVACLKAHENLVSGEIFNVGNQDQTFAFSHLASLLSLAMPKVEIELGEYDEDILKNYKLSCSKIEKILDFKPENDLLESMVEIKEALESNLFPDPLSLRYHNT